MDKRKILQRLGAGEQAEAHLSFRNDGPFLISMTENGMIEAWLNKQKTYGELSLVSINLETLVFTHPKLRLTRPRWHTSGEELFEESSWCRSREHWKDNNAFDHVSEEWEECDFELSEKVIKDME